MGKLKSYQQQVQQVLSKGIDKAEQGHNKLVSRPFDLAEKVEKEAKSYSIKSVRQAHNQYAKNVYSSLRAFNERANSFASDLISRIEKEGQASSTDTQKPVAKKAAARRTTAPAKKPDAATTNESGSTASA